MKEGILQGCRVLDLTRVVAGPYATRILADFGAEVIKIQTGKIASGVENNLTEYFNTWNRNKKSITLNLNYRESREIFCELATQSDVVVENFTPRVMPNWGLSYDKLKKCKPDIIVLSMSGMGQTGPWKDFTAYGPTLQSLGGLTYLTSFMSKKPQGLGYSYADHILGLYGAISVLAALEYRERTGVGQYIDLSGFEAVCTLIGPELLNVAANKRDMHPMGNCPSQGQVLPCGCYQCQGTDQWCVIALSREDQWQTLCQIMGHPAWSKDEQFATPLGRLENRQKLDALIEEWTRNMAIEDVVQFLNEAGIPVGVVQNARDLASDPQLRARDFFVTLEHSLLGNLTSDTYPFKFPDCGVENWQASPLLGEDNNYVFGELLNMSTEKISRLKDLGIIG